MKTLRSFLNNVLGNDRGFSIVQGLAVAAALGGVSLALLQQNKISNQQSRTASTSIAVLELQGQIQNYLLMDTACKLSLQSAQLPTDLMEKPISSIKNELDVDVFVVGETYLNNQVQITDMTFVRSSSSKGVLKVTFNKKGNENNRGTGAAQVRKDYELNAQWTTPAGNLIKCYSDIGNAVDTAVDGVLAGLCKDLTATEANGLEWDAAAGFCQLTQLGSTPNITDLCPQDQAVTEITYDASTRKYSKKCEPVYKNLPTSCDNDSLIRRKSDGTFDCVKPVCSGNGIFQGLSSSGAAICVACGKGEVAVSLGGIFVCKPMACTDPNTYFLGLDTSGTPICNQLIESGTCSGAGKLVAAGGGKVKFECCNAACGDSSTKCSGTVYPSTNGCGSCSGTMAAACGDPSTQCQGSYPSSNGCGSCNGTKLPQNGVWSGWSGTSEFRAKSGATCSCATKLVAQERKYIRGCTQPQCGGAACVGDSEEWRDEGTQSCTPTGCTPAGRCKGSGYDSSMFVQSNLVEVQNGCRTQYRDVYMDIVPAHFKVGNIYYVGQGGQFTAEVLPGDTANAVLNRIASKINSANMTYPTLCNGAGSTVVTNATVSGNTLKYHINWQHQPGIGASRSCNIADEATCSSTPGCSWDTTSANFCVGMNYQAKVGTCNGTYYQQGCTHSDPNSGQGMNCKYNYDTQSECSGASSQGCYWGSIANSCYASTQAECTAVSGCSWKASPDEHRSCTAVSWESGCTQYAPACSWVPR